MAVRAPHLPRRARERTASSAAVVTAAVTRGRGRALATIARTASVVRRVTVVGLGACHAAALPDADERPPSGASRRPSAPRLCGARRRGRSRGTRARTRSRQTRARGRAARHQRRRRQGARPRAAHGEGAQHRHEAAGLDRAPVRNCTSARGRRAEEDAGIAPSYQYVLPCERNSGLWRSYLVDPRPAISHRKPSALSDRRSGARAVGSRRSVAHVEVLSPSTLHRRVHEDVLNIRNHSVVGDATHKPSNRLASRAVHQ